MGKNDATDQAGTPPADGAPAEAAPATAVVGVVTAEQVQTMISEAIKAHLADDHASTALVAGVSLLASPSAPAPKGPIDAKYLKGLTFRTSRSRKGGPGDDDATVHETITRDLTPEDVLDWADKGDRISFVTADGQSVKVKK